MTQILITKAYKPEPETSQFADENGEFKTYIKSSFIGTMNGEAIRVTSTLNIDFTKYVDQIVELPTLAKALKAGQQVLDKQKRKCFKIVRAEKDALNREVYLIQDNKRIEITEEKVKKEEAVKNTDPLTEDLKNVTKLGKDRTLEEIEAEATASHQARLAQMEADIKLLNARNEALNLLDSFISDLKKEFKNEKN